MGERAAGNQDQRQGGPGGGESDNPGSSALEISAEGMTQVESREFVHGIVCFGLLELLCFLESALRRLLHTANSAAHPIGGNGNETGFLLICTGAV